MNMIRLQKKDLATAMARASESFAMAGPVPDRGGHIFRRLDPNECPDLTYTYSTLSPKALLFPQAETLFYFTLPARAKGEKEKKPPAFLEAESREERPLAVVGIRPYDARAFDLLKLNFDAKDYQDPFFLNRYQAMVRVGLADQAPDPANFSLAAGSGPFDESGLDILLADAGDSYLGKVITDKGDAFASAAGFDPGGTGAVDEFAAMKQKAEALVDNSPGFDKIFEAGTLDLHEADFWEAAAFSCINCGACTFSCPTCWCFDIQDEVKQDKGARLRIWDTCMAGLYSAHASGHNPRLAGYQRFRNRFMHKLKYFHDKYGAGIMCVGCGRCIIQCPAGVDIRTVAAAMNRAADRSSRPAGGIKEKEAAL